MPAARLCQRVAFNIFLCFFLRIRLRRFFISEPMSDGRLVGGAPCAPRASDPLDRAACRSSPAEEGLNGITSGLDRPCSARDAGWKRGGRDRFLPGTPRSRQATEASRACSTRWLLVLERERHAASGRRRGVPAGAQGPSGGGRRESRRPVPGSEHRRPRGTIRRRDSRSASLLRGRSIRKPHRAHRGLKGRVSPVRNPLWRVVQPAERLTLDQEVGGSSPPPPASESATQCGKR